MKRAIIFFGVIIFIFSASSVFAQDSDCDRVHQELCADLNNNGIVDVSDLVRFINIIGGNIELDSLPKYLEERDCDCDNLHFTICDYYAIYKRIIYGYSAWMRGIQVYSETDTINVSTLEASPGDEIEIPVYIDTERELIGLQSYIRYDLDLITVTDFEFSETLQDGPHGTYLVDGGISLYFLILEESDFDGFVGYLRANINPDTPVGSEILLAFGNDPHRALYTGLADTYHSDQSRIIELHFIHPVKDDGIITVVESRLANDDEDAPVSLSASPNPFNNSTNLTFQIERHSKVRIDIYDMLGRRIINLLDGDMAAGDHSVVWNADQLPSGVYFCRLAADDHSMTTRITLLK